MKKNNHKTISEKQLDTFLSRRVFCFTLDIDWATEAMIEKTLRIFDSFNMPVTVFLTHQSAIIARTYGNKEMRRHVGLHPNFLSDKDYRCVVDSSLKLWPKATSFRSHGFSDSTYITREYANHKFHYDSNLGLFLQPKCMPLLHHSGLIRFPVFWEDDVHIDKFLNPPKLMQIKKELKTPGLKVFNFHPFHVSLNTPSPSYYQKHRFLYEGKSDFQKYVHPGDGIETFLREILEYMVKNNLKPEYLDDIYRDLTLQTTKY